MKKIFTIALAMGALSLVSASASAQGSRHMERRSQGGQYDDRSYGNSQYEQPAGGYGDSRRPKVEVSFSIGGGYDRYNDHGRYRRYQRSRYERDRFERRRYERSRYWRSYDRNCY